MFFFWLSERDRCPRSSVKWGEGRRRGRGGRCRHGVSACPPTSPTPPLAPSPPPSLVDTFTSRRVPSGVVSGDGLACGGRDGRSGREREGEGTAPSPFPPPLPQAESLEGGVEGRPGSSVRVLRSLRRIAQGGHTRAGGETGREGGGPKEPPTEREKGHLSRGRRGEGGRGEGGGGFVLRYCLCLSCKSVSVFLYVRIDL